MYHGYIITTHMQYIPPNTVIGNRFIIHKFLTEESHAEVYLVKDSLLVREEETYHAHVFLSGLLPDGVRSNWPNFVKRSIDRMRKRCIAETKFAGRTCLIIVAGIRQNQFNRGKFSVQFPSLPKPGKAPYPQLLGSI
jgi:hypothetical protein